MPGRTYSARVMKFRESVFASRKVSGRGITPGCQLLLLRLSDSMDADANVSVPQTVLTRDLAAPKTRISEWVREAVESGFLSRKVQGKPGVTSEYQGLVVDPRVLRQGVTTDGVEGGPASYATRDQHMSRQGVTTESTDPRSASYATHPPQVTTEPEIAQREPWPDSDPWLDRGESA